MEDLRTQGLRRQFGNEAGADRLQRPHASELARQSSLAFAQSRANPLGLGDVPQDFGGPDDRSAGIANRRDGDRDIKEPSVACDTAGLVVLDPLARSQLSEVVLLLIAQ